MTDNTRLIDLTVKELREVIMSMLPKEESDGTKEIRAVYSLKELAKAVNLGESTVLKLKKEGRFDSAIKQMSDRRYIYEVDLIRELLNESYKPRKRVKR